MQMCACLKEHMRVGYVFCALCMVWPGRIFTKCNLIKWVGTGLSTSDKQMWKNTRL